MLTEALCTAPEPEDALLGAGPIAYVAALPQLRIGALTHLTLAALLLHLNRKSLRSSPVYVASCKLANSRVWPVVIHPCTMYHVVHCRAH